MAGMVLDEEAEAELIGALLCDPVRVVDEVGTMVDRADFATARFGEVWHAAVTLRSSGEFQPGQSSQRLLDASGKAMAYPEAVDLMGGSPGSASAPRWARRVVRASVARRLQFLARDLTSVAQNDDLDTDGLVDQARTLAASVNDLAPLASVDVPGLTTLDGFLARPREEVSAWIVPGLFRQGWRVLVVAPEGHGKSVLARALCIQSAAGVHPLHLSPIEPIRTLIVDLENPDDAIEETCAPIASKHGTTEDRCWLWRRPQGINLRDRTGRMALDRVLAQTRPDLVCAGPVYKMQRSTARESDEQVAAEVQGALDDLRARYGFALLLEHHAPKGSGMSGGRDLMPYGSSLWLRWPELGLKLVPDQDGTPKGSLVVGRFRQDRMRNGWPDRLDRGQDRATPWLGWWRNGYERGAA